MFASPTTTQKAFISSDERGLSTVEYVIILVLIAAAAVGTWRLLGGTVKSKLEDATTTIRDMHGDGQNSGNSNTNRGAAPSQPLATSGQAPPPPGKAAGKVAD